MATERNLQTTGTLAADIVGVWLVDELLERAERNLVFYDLCRKTNIPERNGQIAQFTRYERLPAPTRPLEEGVTPSLTPLQISTVQCVLDQWGATVGITDRADMTVKHPTMQIARDLLSDQHDRTVDREIQVVLLNSAAVTFAGNATTRATITAADVITTDTVRKAVANLRHLGARPFGRWYRGVHDPFVEGDISNDPTFVTASSYSQIMTLKDFMTGTWMGVLWSRSNHMPIISAMAAADIVPTAVTGGSIASGGTGFDASSSVITKVTRLNPESRIE